MPSLFIVKLIGFLFFYPGRTKSEATATGMTLEL
jgi:hypothetical protein